MPIFQNKQLLSSGAYVSLYTGGIVKCFWQGFGHNQAPLTKFLQFFDLAIIPVLGNIPLISILVPSLTNFSIGLPVDESGYTSFPIGLRVVSSSTGSTYTPSATVDDFWLNFIVAL